MQQPRAILGAFKNNAVHFSGWKGVGGEGVRGWSSAVPPGAGVAGDGGGSLAAVLGSVF